MNLTIFPACLHLWLVEQNEYQFMRNPEDPEYITLSAVQKRGWNNRLIDSLLGEPDQIKKNPRSRSFGRKPSSSNFPPMRLYLKQRVIDGEKTKEFADHYAKHQKRSAVASKVSGTKKAAMIDWANSIQIPVSIMPWDTLLREAYRSYNEHNEGKDDYDRTRSVDAATQQSDQAFLERIVVNYLRHQPLQTEILGLSQKFVDVFGEADRIAQRTSRIYQNLRQFRFSFFDRQRLEILAIQLQQIESVKDYGRTFRTHVEALEQLERRSALFV